MALSKQEQGQDVILNELSKLMPVAFVGEESCAIKTREDSLNGKRFKYVIHAGISLEQFQIFYNETQENDGSVAIVKNGAIELHKGGISQDIDGFAAKIRVQPNGAVKTESSSGDVMEYDSVEDFIKNKPENIENHGMKMR